MTNRTKQLVRLAGLATLLAMGVACHGILTVDNPGQIADTDLNSKDAIPGLVAGMSNRLSNSMGYVGGNMVTYSALVSGEMFHGGSYSWDQDPVGFTTPDDGYLGGAWGAVQVARWVAEFVRDKVGTFDTELVQEWFQAFAMNSGITLHVETLYGTNDHHRAEALFKALGRALDAASRIDERISGKIPSTKDRLETAS